MSTGGSNSNSIASIPSHDDYGIIVMDSSSFTGPCGGGAAGGSTLRRDNSSNGSSNSASSAVSVKRSLAALAMLETGSIGDASEGGLVEGKCAHSEGTAYSPPPTIRESSVSRVLRRNAKFPNSDIFKAVVLPVMQILEDAADEMKGDSEETRKETKEVILELGRVLSALDKQTDGALTSDLLSNLVGFFEEDIQEGEEEEDM